MKVKQVSGASDYTSADKQFSVIRYMESNVFYIQMNLCISATYIREIRFASGTWQIQTRYKSGGSTGAWKNVTL